MGVVMDINKLYQYITAFNSINITIKNIAINTEDYGGAQY